MYFLAPRSQEAGSLWWYFGKHFAAWQYSTLAAGPPRGPLLIVVDFTEKIKVPKKILPRPTERCHAKVG